MALNNLDLNKLKCFQAVAEKGALLEGAKLLNLTPSAVYQSVKKLEDELQKHLFFRSGKKYILTDEGRSLQEIFQRFLWEFSEFQSHVGLTSGEALEGDIRVGLPLNFSKSIFIPMLRQFNDKYPRIRFHLTIAETHRLVKDVLSFSLDFAITDDAIPPEARAKIVKQDLFKEELVLVCSQDFATKNEKALKSSKLIKELTHLDYSHNLPLIQRWYKLNSKRQVKISHFHNIDNVETMVAALRSGLGIGIIPRVLLDEPGLKKELQEISPQSGSLYNQLFLVQEGNYINNTMMKKFLQFQEEFLKEKKN